MRRASQPVDFGLVLWLLAHKDLKGTARVRALLRFLADALTATRGGFLGERSEAAEGEPNGGAGQ